MIRNIDFDVYISRINQSYYVDIGSLKNNNSYAHIILKSYLTSNSMQL